MDRDTLIPSWVVKYENLRLRKKSGEEKNRERQREEKKNYSEMEILQEYPYAKII